MQTMLQQIQARQSELFQAMVISNGLAIAGRLIEIGIGIMLALVLVRLNELCRERRAP